MVHKQKMNILTTIVVLLISISYSTSQQRAEIALNTAYVNTPKISSGFTIDRKDYSLHFDIEQTKDQKFTLVIAIELHNGARFISPNEKQDFSGKLFMDLGSYTNLDFKGIMIEDPWSIEIIDKQSSTNAPVYWVNENTTYKQPLHLKSKEDFEVFGRLRFTIEPRSTLEEIPFAISYKDGILKIKYMDKC